MQSLQPSKVYLGQLALRGFPSGNALRACNVYALSEEDDTLAEVLLWGTVVDVCATHTQVCVIAAKDPAASIRQSAHADEVRAAMNSKQLRILRATFLSHDATGTSLVSRIIDDLRFWHADQHGLLIIDDADTLFANLNEEDLRVWKSWAEQHDSCVLMLFRQSGVLGEEPMVRLSRLAHCFAGMARLKSRYGNAEWEIFHWFAPSGLVAARTFPIRLAHDRRLETVEAGRNETAEPAPDEMQIIAERAVFLPKETPVRGWQWMDAGVDALLSDASDRMAATIALAFTPNTDFQRLIRNVFDLRKRCGPRLKIVIRELNARLRYSQETLVIRLGANLIVPAEISYARFLSLTSMVQGQIFPHALPATFEQAVRDAMPEDEQGYLPPDEFVGAVARMVKRSRLMHMYSVLIRLPLAYGLLPLDALRYCTIRRAGDFCSSDDVSVYLFLYGCRENDVDPAIERLFSLPPGELFGSDERFLSTSAIRDAMADFDARRRTHVFPDLSDALAAVAQPQPQAQVTAQADSIRKGRAVEMFPAPRPALRRPLALKGTPALVEVPMAVS